MDLTDLDPGLATLGSMDLPSKYVIGYEKIVETAREAGGAEPGPTVRNVLVWIIALVVIAFVGIYLAFVK